MKVLVMSDSHGDSFSAALAVEQQPQAEYVFHLGDGEHDIDDLIAVYRRKDFIKVRGNCDFLSDLNVSVLVEIAGKRIFATHGYAQYVKQGLTSLYFAAREKNADIALFGHTHSPMTDIYNGLAVFNPGSVRDGNYGVLEITPQGITCSHEKVRYV